MPWLQRLAERLLGPWCEALDPDEQPTCWQRIPPGQPGRFCDDCWNRLAHDGTISQRVELAFETPLPPPVVDVLVKDPSAMVRAALAEKPSLSSEHRGLLAVPGEDPRVLRKLAGRPDLTEREERVVASCDDLATLRVLAANPAVSDEVRARLATHHDPGIRRVAAEAPHL